MPDRIVAYGAAPEQCPPPLQRWPDHLTDQHPKREFRVCGNHFFVFRPDDYMGWHFIKVLHLPQEFLRLWHRQLRQWQYGE